MAGAAKKGPTVDLAIVMGKPKGRPDGAPMTRDEPDGDDGDGELPAGFEEAFAEAFPEAAGDAERMQALKRLIHICAGRY